MVFVEFYLDSILRIMDGDIEESPKSLKLLHIISQLVGIVFYKIESILVGGPKIDEVAPVKD